MSDRKHWSSYPSNSILYGQHRHGFGIYHIGGQDYWLDEECATDYERKKYAEYMKSKGYTDDGT